MTEANEQKNNHIKSLTIERLRQFEGLRVISDEDAKQVIESLDQLSRIIFEYWQKQRDSSS